MQTRFNGKDSYMQARFSKTSAQPNKPDRSGLNKGILGLNIAVEIHWTKSWNIL